MQGDKGVYIYMYVYIYMCIYIYIYIYNTYVYIYTHIYLHIYSSVQLSFLCWTLQIATSRRVWRQGIMCLVCSAIPSHCPCSSPLQAVAQQTSPTWWIAMNVAQGLVKVDTDVGSVPPTWQHGRYRRSFDYTYGELRSISTVGSVHSTQKSVDIDHIGRFIQKKNRATVDIDRRSGQTLKKTQKKCWYRVCVPILHNVNRWKQLSVNNFKRISLNNTHTHRDHDGHGQECVKIVFILTKLCL